MRAEKKVGSEKKEDASSPNPSQKKIDPAFFVLHHPGRAATKSSPPVVA